MKRKIECALALILALCLLTLVSCGAGDAAATGSVTLVVAGEATTEYAVELDGLDLTKGVIAVLDKLKSEGKLDYSMNGTMLESVGDVCNDAAANEWIYIYTSVAADADVSVYAMTVEYKGQTLTSSGVGALEMHIENGAVIYITTVSWS